MSKARYIVVAALLVGGGLALSQPADADCQKELSGGIVCGAGPCARDMQGRAYCARFRFGTVQKTTEGQMVCGKGQCARTLNGDFLCSTADGGGAAKRLDGTVECQGGCEPASTDLCERSGATR